MNEWPIVRFEQLAADEKSSFSKPYGSAYTKDDYVPDGIPLVRGVNLGNGIFHDEDFVFIAEEKANKLPGANLAPGDIVITHRGTIGQLSMIPRCPRYPRYVLSTSQVKARLDNRCAVPEFYYYWFSSPAGQHELLSHVSTVGVPGLVQPVATVKSLKVPHPSLPEQKAIADLLWGLDSKIVANDRIATAIDSLVETLFEELMASHPNIQEAKLGDIAFVNRVSIKPPGFGKLRYIDISSVRVGSYDWPDSILWSEAPGRARRKARFGDTIWSTVRPNRRSHALVLDADPELVFSSGLAILSPKSVGPAFLYEVTRTKVFKTYLKNVAEGSAYPAVRAELFNAAPVSLPPIDARAKFEQSAMSLRLRAHQARLESRTLAALRDLLLRELMSRRLQIRNAKRIVGDAV